MNINMERNGMEWFVFNFLLQIIYLLLSFFLSSFPMVFNVFKFKLGFYFLIFFWEEEEGPAKLS